ncbi:O-antigen ligase family protein [Zunongwangia profunda]|uniref:O-antigen ligase family protein n=1 Tax=Zunongwangia profunda TaxID=398743 RepID=UPI002354904F|nr:O-antigen ligase family protein [Zunongwangia profunda]|tara:strand:- start:3987 stop:5354 length:1368 start_codon:yes stop_codon:yes gene_type:complete
MELQVNQNRKQYFQLLLLHIAMAFAIYIFRPISFILTNGILLFWLIYILQKKNRNNEALMAAAYVAGGEVYFRMTDGIIFYETGKYMVIVFLLLGMFFKGTSSKTVPYWLFILMMVPGILVSAINISYGADFRKLVAFNLSGPVCLGIVAVYCYYKKIKKSDFEKVILMLLLPLISNMFYLYLYTPSLKESLINVSANYLATGGYGPNQVSTIFGMGFFLICTRLFLVKDKLVNLIDFILLGLMGYRAVVTFSRGGVFTGIICISTFLIFYYYKMNRKSRSAVFRKILFIGAVGLGVWTFSLVKTYGLIGNRYTNKDASGKLKADITTGRSELIETELHAFINHPILGIGVGKGTEYREEQLGISIATHNEISRMLSEQGLLGLISLLILIFVPVIFWFKFENNYYFLAFLAFWFLTINHSAMRIALPAFVYGLALLYIVDDKKDPVYRKRLAGR